MEKVIIIKYAELSTKSDNINFFIVKNPPEIIFCQSDFYITVRN